MTEKTPHTERHRTDLLSLIFGLLFLAAAGAWAGSYYLHLPWRLYWDLPNLGWIVAGALILIGLLGILASLRRERTGPEPARAAEPASDHDRPD